MRHRFVTLGGVVIVMTMFIGASNAADDLAATIGKLDGTVATADEKESLASQVRDNLRVRMQQANDRSTAEWQSVRSRDDWERLRSVKLAALRASLGAWPERQPLFNILTTSEIPGDGFRIENTLFESRHGWWVSANLYVPETPLDSMPGIVICHAHHTPKQHGELQDMGMTWARAGCCVLVLDQVGHGERRQHPFETAADYTKPFGVGRQDYYFRYDNAIQLHLVGESLVGWMAWDMMRGVDLLLMLKGIDPQRIMLLGSVAGGGDPAAVTGALDDRIAAVVPFNFGGPQPETRFPLPDDIERSFHYAGSGGWESTRNLQLSARDGFLPWMIVGGVAPRRLVYAHEFNWDQERDPVWKRLQTIYGLYEKPEFLSFTHGRGEVTGKSPQDTHCTHIGGTHRVKIHEAFRQWFGIDVTPESEFSDRVPAERLRCWTDELKQAHRPKSLAMMTTELADVQVAKIRLAKQPGSAEQHRLDMQTSWDKLLGGVTPERLKEAHQRVTESPAPARVERWMLTAESGIRIPCVVLKPEKIDRHKPMILAICSQGKNRLLKDRAAEIAALVEGGATVCLIDPRGLGESKLGDGHTRRSSATSHSSTGLMLGSPLLGEQLRDVRLALTWLRRRSDGGFRPLVVWGESLVPPNPSDAAFRTPRDDDDALPAVSEPQAPLLALLAGLFEDDLNAIYTVGGLVSWRSLLASHLVLTAHDVIVPGVLTAGDLSDIVVVQQPNTRIRMEALVDGWNRAATDEAMMPLRDAALKGTFQAARRGLVPWVFEE